MATFRNPRRMLYILVFSLTVAAAAISLMKIRFFGFSLSDRAAFFYQVDANITLEPSGDGPIRISLAVPEPDAGWAFGLDPDSRTRFLLQKQNGFPRLMLTLPKASAPCRVSCRYRLVPAPLREAPFLSPPESAGNTLLADPLKLAASTILDRVDPNRNRAAAELVPVLLRQLEALPPEEKRVLSQNSGSEGTVNAAIAILNLRGIPARVLRGIQLDQKRYQQQPSLFLDVWHGGRWHIYQPNTGMLESPCEFLILQRSDKSLLEVTGASNSSIRFSVTKVPAGAEQLNRIRAKILDDRSLSLFSLFSLPASEQNLFKRLALLPLAILLIVIVRNVIGITTMGTFMPVLIAMAFLEMRLLPGLVNFVLILTVGLGIRAWLSQLNLLMVPRISAVVVVVILLMQLISVGANLLNLPEFVDATFFPIIIIAWTIERASMSWEEDGAKNTLRQLASSIAASAICYLVLSSGYLQYVLYTFAELNLVILGVILLLGTYTGYRFTELIRFQPLVKK